MIILALDTTSEFGSLAISSNGQILAQHALHSPEGFAHLIYPAIERLLAQTEVRLAEIDCFAAASGPGSFTGVRVGLAAVKGLAEAMSKAALGVSNLRALSSFGNLPLRAVVLDARRGEFYTAVYNRDLAPVVPEAVGKISPWLETLAEPMYQFISPVPLPLEGTRFANMPCLEPPRTLAAAVAHCVEMDQRAWLDPAALDANYVRRADAEMFWKES